MIDDGIKIAKLFNKYLVNIVKKLRLFTKEQSAVYTENNLSEVEIVTEKYKNHPSMNTITENEKKPGKNGKTWSLYIWLWFHFEWGHSKRGQKL